MRPENVKRLADFNKPEGLKYKHLTPVEHVFLTKTQCTILDYIRSVKSISMEEYKLKFKRYTLLLDVFIKLNLLERRDNKYEILATKYKIVSTNKRLK